MQNGRRKKQTGTRPDDNERDDSTIREEEPPLKKSVEFSNGKLCNHDLYNDYFTSLQVDISISIFAFTLGFCLAIML